MNGRIAVSRVKIDESVSYCVAACWAGVIDNEVHVSSLSLQANGGRSKGSAKDYDVARMHGRLAMAPQLNRPDTATLPCEFVETRWVKYPQLSTASISVELRSFYAWTAPAVGNCFIENLAKSGWRKQLIGRFVQTLPLAARIRQMTN